jgi:hypothetical protein
MPRHSICLINWHDADQLKFGIALKCSEHKHIDTRSAQLMVSGTKIRPFLDPDHDPLKRDDQPVSESYKATAHWARVPHVACAGNGCEHCDKGMVNSGKYLVMMAARAWQVINGAQQFAPIGRSRQLMKRSHTRCRNRRQMYRAGHDVSTRKTDTTRSANEIAMQICRPSLLRRQLFGQR